MSIVQLNLIDEDGGDWSRLLCGVHPPKKCRNCWHYLPECCFRRHHNPHTRMGVSQHLHGKCRACEQEHRDKVKRRRRYYTKAKDALHRHMRIERKQGLHNAASLEQYLMLTGMSISWVADQFSRKVIDAVSCAECEAVIFLGPGETPSALPMHQMTVDRPDRARLLGTTNFQIVCATCNTAKGKLDVHTYDVMRRLWRLRRSQVLVA